MEHERGEGGWDMMDVCGVGGGGGRSLFRNHQ